MQPYQRSMALHRASLSGPIRHKPYQKPRPNIHENSRCPHISPVRSLEGRQSPQVPGTLSTPRFSW